MLKDFFSKLFTTKADDVVTPVTVNKSHDSQISFTVDPKQIPADKKSSDLTELNRFQSNLKTRNEGNLSGEVVQTSEQKAQSEEDLRTQKALKLDNPFRG